MDKTARYVQGMGRAVDTARRKWALKGDSGGDFYVLWETHHEAAKYVSRVTHNFSCDRDEMRELIRGYFGHLAVAVRANMATTGMSCTSARKFVATRTLQRDVEFRNMVKSQACRAAAALLAEAEDSWVTNEAVTLPETCIGGKALWDEHVTAAQHAVRAALDSVTKPDQVTSLFGGFFTEFMVTVCTRRHEAEQQQSCEDEQQVLPWGVTRGHVVKGLLAKDLSCDPVREAAWTAAALLLDSMSPPPPPPPPPPTPPAVSTVGTVSPNMTSACLGTPPRRDTAGSLPAATKTVGVGRRINSFSAPTTFGMPLPSTVPSPADPSTVRTRLAAWETASGLVSNNPQKQRGGQQQLQPGVTTSPAYAAVTPSSPSARTHGASSSSSPLSARTNGTIISSPPPSGSARTHGAASSSSSPLAGSKQVRKADTTTADSSSTTAAMIPSPTDIIHPAPWAKQPYGHRCPGVIMDAPAPTINPTNAARRSTSTTVGVQHGVNGRRTTTAALPVPVLPMTASSKKAAAGVAAVAGGAGARTGTMAQPITAVSSHDTNEPPAARKGLPPRPRPTLTSSGLPPRGMATTTECRFSTSEKNVGRTRRKGKEISLKSGAGVQVARGTAVQAAAAAAGAAGVGVGAEEGVGGSLRNEGYRNSSSRHQRRLDGVGAGSSGPFGGMPGGDAPSLPAMSGAAQAVGVEAVGVGAAGVAASLTQFSPDQSVGGLGPGSSGPLTSRASPATTAEAVGIRTGVAASPVPLNANPGGVVAPASGKSGMLTLGAAQATAMAALAAGTGNGTGVTAYPTPFSANPGVGALGSSSSGLLAPGAAQAMGGGMEAVGVGAGVVAASSTKFNADQRVGGLGRESSGLLTSRSAPVTTAEAVVTGAGVASSPAPLSANQSVGGLGVGSSRMPTSGTAPAVAAPEAAARDWDSVLGRVVSSSCPQPPGFEASESSSSSSAPMRFPLPPPIAPMAAAEAATGSAARTDAFPQQNPASDRPPLDNNSELCGVGLKVPTAPDATAVAAAAAAAAVEAAAAVAAAGVTPPSPPEVSCWAGAEAWMATVEALPNTFNSSEEAFSTFAPPTSSGREKTMNISGAGGHTGSGVNGPMHDDGDDGGSGLRGLKRKVVSGGDGECENHPGDDGGLRKKARSG